MPSKRKAPRLFTAKEEGDLLKIPYVKGKGEHTDKLAELANKWGREYANVWQKWYALHKSAPKTTKSAPVNNSGKVSPPVTNPAKAAMVFAAVAFDDSRMKIDDGEVEAMQRGLDNSIATDLKTPKRGILFPTKMEKRAKDYLKKKYPTNVFSFHAYAKDKKYKILVKKV